MMGKRERGNIKLSRYCSLIKMRRWISLLAESDFFLHMMSDLHHRNFKLVALPPSLPLKEIHVEKHRKTAVSYTFSKTSRLDKLSK